MAKQKFLLPAITLNEGWHAGGGDIVPENHMTGLIAHDVTPDS